MFGCQVEVRTRGGVAFEVEKRFSDFRALHDEWLAPVMSVGFTLPLPDAVLTGKNDEETIRARKRGLTTYLREVIRNART